MIKAFAPHLTLGISSRAWPLSR